MHCSRCTSWPRQIHRCQVPITEILSLLDQMVKAGSVPEHGCSVEELRLWRTLLDRAILEVLDYSHDPRDPSTIPADLTAVARWVYEIGEVSRIALITTNYDEVLGNGDLSMFHRKERVPRLAIRQCEL